MPPRKLWKLRGYEIASENIFEPKQCFSEDRRQSFTYMNIHPFSLLCHIALGSAFQSFANLTNADEACETNHSLGRAESWWKTRKRFFHTVCSHLVLCFNMSPRCVCAIGIRRVLVLFYNTKQAMGKGKSCSVETRLNGLVATALYRLQSHLRQ